jgi:hypothetical protein
MPPTTWHKPPIFPATLKLSRLVLALKKKELDDKLQRLHSLLQKQLRRANGELGNSKSEPTDTGGTD